MSTKVKLEMKPIATILARLGIDKNGRVQRFLTETVNRRITRYMPFRTGVLASKLKFVSSPTEITVNGPYARYQYYGKLWVDHITGSAFSPKYGWKVPTNIPLNYHRPGHGGENGSGNSEAGPFWDRRLMAAEKDVILREVGACIKRGGHS